MEKNSYYRVGIKIEDPSRLSKYFLDQHSEDINKNRLYLGIRFNLVPEKQAASIGSMDLALKYIALTKELLAEELGEVNFYMTTHFYSNALQRSIIETDTAMLQSNIELRASSGVQQKQDDIRKVAIGA